MRVGLRFAGAVAAVACVVPASAGAVPLHGLTAISCISDRDAGETCGGPDDGPNEAQGLELAEGVAVSPDGTSVYVASTDDNAVARFVRAPGGTLTRAGCISDIDDAQTCGGNPGGANEAQGLAGARGVAVSPDGSSVYVTSGTGDKAIVRFNRAADGSLTAAGCIDDGGGLDICGGNETAGLDGATGVVVSPDGASIYVASENSSAVVRFSRAPNGGLTPADCLEDSPGAVCGPGNNFEGLAIAQGLAISPDGDSVYVASFGDLAITRFARAGDGTLTYDECIDAIGGGAACAAEAKGMSGPAGVAVSPDSSSIYVVSRNTPSSIAHFDFDGLGAGLTEVGCVSDLDALEVCGGLDGGPEEAQGLNGAWGVAVSPDGGTVHVASFLDNAVTSFPRPPDGSLSGLTATCIVDPLGPANCGPGNAAEGLQAVRGIAVSPGGESVYGVSFIDNAITRFNRELAPGCSVTTASGVQEQPLTVNLNCGDPNNDPLDIATVEAPANGTLEAVNQAADTVVYTPNPGFAGTDSFTYAATADSKQSPPVRATISISATDALGPPQQGKTVNLRPVSGRILVDIPRDGQGFIPIEFAVQVPVRTKVNARKGRVAITTATEDGGTQTAEFHDGLFQIRQGKRNDLATMRLLEKPKCGGASGGRNTLAARKRRPGLWGSGNGNFATQGNHGSASVRGTRWLIFEACGGITGTKVKQGRVLFRNFYTGRRTIVRAGETAIARPLPRP